MREELLKPGDKLGRYELHEMMGQDGMGQVYRAWDATLGRDVAVKVLTPTDEATLKRFARKAAAVGGLGNHHVVAIHDLRTDGPHPYIVMEHLRGESLHSRLKRGRLEIEEAVEVILSVCCGVHACHHVGIVHRDLKPANVFLSATVEYGVVVKVLDCGVTTPVPLSVDEDVPVAEQVIGSRQYLAPERVHGANADELSDQYQIGLLLYVCLTGEPPFAGKDEKELVGAIANADYRPLREHRAEVPVELEQVVMRAMEAARAARFPSVLALARALVPYASSQNRELWQEVFESCDEAPSAREDADIPGELEPTLVVELGEVEALAKSSALPEVPITPAGNSDEPGAIDSGASITVPGPVSGLGDSPKVMGSATGTKSAGSGLLSMEKRRGAPTANWRRLRVSGRALLFVVLAAAGLGSVSALLLTRGRSDAAVPKWSAMVLPGADAGVRTAQSDSEDAREDAQAPNGASVPIKEAVEEEIPPAATGDAAKQEPAREAGKKRRPRRVHRVEFTAEGSPILD